MQRQSPPSVVMTSIAAALVLVILALVVRGYGAVAGGTTAGGADNEDGFQSIAVYGFSVAEEALADDIFPAFQSEWLAQRGQEIVLHSTFLGSEEITGIILEGTPAQVAFLANEQHAIWLRINGLIDTDWRALPHEGVVSRSPIVIVVRSGNPLRIRDWQDLARPAVEVIHASPHTSGGAQWALLAEYGSALLGENGSTEAAAEQLRGIWANVILTPSSSREALREFVFGVGDVLITYEQDALLAVERGASLEIVMPESTVMSEHIVAIVDRNIRPWERAAVEGFVHFLWTPEAQSILTDYYFRAATDEALNEAVPEFEQIEHLFSAEDLGGWGQAYAEIIRGVWEEEALDNRPPR